jgi:hypothetical protein
MSDMSPVPLQQNEIDRYDVSSPASSSRPRSFCSACALTGCLLSALAVLGITAVVFAVTRNPCARLEGPLPFLYSLVCESGTDVSVAPPGIYEIRALGRLDTVEWNLSTVVEVVNPRGPLGKLNETLDYAVCGRVIAGVDLTKLQESDVTVMTDTLIIALPPPEVFSVAPTLALDVDPKEVTAPEDPSTRVSIEPACNHAHIWNTPLGLSRSPELIRVAQEEAVKQFRQIAETSSILDLAASNAEKEVARVLIFAGYKKVSFRYKPDIAD